MGGQPNTGVLDPVVLQLLAARAAEGISQEGARRRDWNNAVRRVGVGARDHSADAAAVAPLD